jgi:hypothetical protein
MKKYSTNFLTGMVVFGILISATTVSAQSTTSTRVGLSRQCQSYLINASMLDTKGMQEFLIKEGFLSSSYKIGFIPIFDTETKTALTKWQQDNNIIPATGEQDQQTITAINERISATGGMSLLTNPLECPYSQSQTSTASAITTQGATLKTISTTEMIDKNLEIGDSGADVINLQKYLEKKGFLTMPQGVSEGYFGLLTKKALIVFQRVADIPATGYCGTITRGIINIGGE